MAAKSLGRYYSGSSATPTTFTIPTGSDFRPNAMLPQYPTSLAFWHNPHLLQQPIPDHSAAAAQAQMPGEPPEQKKHKRTRSGCFTCRSRRIKCDETHPVCERCSKGKRECVYPPAPEPRKGSRSNLKSSAKHPPIAESESEDDGRRQDGQSVKSGGAEQRQQHSGLSSRARNTLSRRRSAQSLAKRKARQGTESASTPQETCSSPSTDLTSFSTDSFNSDAAIDLSCLSPESPSDILSDLPGISNLKPDIQFFLAYRRKYVTGRHYFLSPHKEEFVQEEMVRYALEYEPLLYAVVGFAAYHYSFAHPNGTLYTFLQYYNQSVSSLLKSLQSKDRHDDSMVLTVLQLTAFEEYLGDWVNLIDHHEAAHRMILELYTPDLVREDEFRRNIVMWCCRFDVMAGLMGGNATILSREWYTAIEEAYRQDAANSPGDLSKYLFAWGSRNRKFAMDLASTFAKVFNGLIDTDGFANENQELVNSLEDLEQSLDRVKDPEQLVTCYPREPRGPEDVIDVPTAIYGGHLLDVNVCAVDLIGATLMYKYQISVVTQNSDLSELKELALNQCRLMEAMLRIADNPTDMLLSFRNTLGFIAVFLGQQDEVHQMWCRRKLAMVEQLGYVYPPTFRNRMADVWKVPDVAHWWLPNDEGYTNIVHEIRQWTNERTVNPRDTSREAVRDMKSIFGRMNLEDSNSASSTPSTRSWPSAERTPD